MKCKLLIGINIKDSTLHTIITIYGIQSPKRVCYRPQSARKECRRRSIVIKEPEKSFSSGATWQIQGREAL